MIAPFAENTSNCQRTNVKENSKLFQRKIFPALLFRSALAYWTLDMAISLSGQLVDAQRKQSKLRSRFDIVRDDAMFFYRID